MALNYYAITDDDIKTLTSVIKHLSNDELKQLLNDESPTTDIKLEELIKDLPQVQNLEKKKELMLAENKSIAEYNLSKETAFRQLKQSLYESHQEALELKKTLERKKDKLDEYNRQTSLDITLALLQTASAQAEEESEDLASSFLSSKMNLDDFLKEYIEKRKLSHLRRIKTEKLMELVRSQSSNDASLQPIRQAPGPPMPSSSTNPFGTPPYPITSTYPDDLPAFPFSRPVHR
ncbi:vacuolar protein sorting-associated protein 37C [Tetranychus urticae]|uniref:VPS37 C-terminal domain-containing protein n=1 Tax=Tetranychus urticae TaxID=32264 RepID=T1KAS4_TETUR|nr:vacuolar protein sorting-associated protein 37C [Tetranychus urticae]